MPKRSGRTFRIIFIPKTTIRKMLSHNVVQVDPTSPFAVAMPTGIPIAVARSASHHHNQRKVLTMNTSEEIRREIVDAFDKCRPAFDALIDQTICTVRHAGIADKSIAIAEFAVAFSNEDAWKGQFHTFMPPASPLQISLEDLHHVFLAYLMSLCLNRLVWP